MSFARACAGFVAIPLAFILLAIVLAISLLLAVLYHLVFETMP